MLRTIYDPEIPVNIYDLGLIYELDVNEAGEVRVVMTLTAPNCPVAEGFPDLVQNALWQVEGEGLLSRFTDTKSMRAIGLALIDSTLRPGQEVVIQDQVDFVQDYQVVSPGVDDPPGQVPAFVDQGQVLRIAHHHVLRSSGVVRQQVGHLLHGAQRDDERATRRAIEKDVNDLNARHAQETAEELPQHDERRRRDDASALATDHASPGHRDDLRAIAGEAGVAGPCYIILLGGPAVVPLPQMVDMDAAAAARAQTTEEILRLTRDG